MDNFMTILIVLRGCKKGKRAHFFNSVLSLVCYAKFKSPMELDEH